MTFNSDKFEWIRYCTDVNQAPDFEYQCPDKSAIVKKTDLKDLGVRISVDLSFDLQVDKVVTTASRMVSWGLRAFRSRGRHLMLVMFKSLVQPHMDYCSQLWSPSSQSKINKIENVQRSLISNIFYHNLVGLSYWDKLLYLRLYSQERRRERYQVIFVWKISQDLVSGYFCMENKPGPGIWLRHVLSLEQQDREVGPAC